MKYSLISSFACGPMAIFAVFSHLDDDFTQPLLQDLNGLSISTVFFFFLFFLRGVNAFMHTWLGC
jgi:hypothetical protein